MMLCMLILDTKSCALPLKSGSAILLYLISAIKLTYISHWSVFQDRLPNYCIHRSQF